MAGITLFVVIAVVCVILALVDRAQDSKAKTKTYDEWPPPRPRAGQIKAVVVGSSPSQVQPPAPQERKKWSGRPTGAYSLRQLTWQQSDCLSELAHSGASALRQANGTYFLVIDGEKLRPLHGKTINSLVRHGLVDLQGDRLEINDHGLRGLEFLPVRY